MSDRFSVAGRRVVITGATQGIGAMLAHAFVAEGASVVAVARDRVALDALAASVAAPAPGRIGDAGLRHFPPPRSKMAQTSTGGLIEPSAAAVDERAPSAAADARCETVVGDLSSEAGCRAVADAVLASGDQLDVLINNAGTALDAPFEEYDDAAWDHVIGVNLKAAAHLTRFLVPALRAAARPADPARVLMMGSIAGLRASGTDNYGYTTTKAALHHLGKHLARRLAPEVTVNVIAPGPFPSRMMGDVLAAHGDSIARTVPMGRIGAADDIAGAALYLASPAARWVTGTVLTVDGGLSLT